MFHIRFFDGGNGAFLSKTKSAESLGKEIHQVGGDETMSPKPLCHGITRECMETDSKACRLKGAVFQRQHGEDDSRQYVTATCSRHPIVAPRTTFFATIR